MINLYELMPEDEIKQFTKRQIKIIEAAIELFAEKGFNGASTSEIAKKAGVAEGTIFRYYKTKKDLLNSISVVSFINSLAPLFMTQFKENVLEQQYACFKDFIQFLFRDRYTFAKNNEAILKILIQEVSLHEDIKDKLNEMFIDEIYPFMNELITYFQKSGEIIDKPVPLIIQFLLSNGLGFIVTSIFIKSIEETDEQNHINDFTDLIIHGLTP